MKYYIAAWDDGCLIHICTEDSAIARQSYRTRIFIEISEQEKDFVLYVFNISSTLGDGSKNSKVGIALCGI